MRMRRSIGFRQIGQSWMRSPQSWQQPCPHRKIMFFPRSRQTGQEVCGEDDRQLGAANKQRKAMMLHVWCSVGQELSNHSSVTSDSGTAKRHSSWIIARGRGVRILHFENSTSQHAAFYLQTVHPQASQQGIHYKRLPKNENGSPRASHISNTKFWHETQMPPHIIQPKGSNDRISEWQ